MRAVIALDSETHENPLIGVARDCKSYRVGTGRLRKSGALPARVAHVAAVAEKPLVGLKARSIRVAHAKPEIAQRQECPGIGAMFYGLEMRARHRGIVAQGWRIIGWKF